MLGFVYAAVLLSPLTIGASGAGADEAYVPQIDLPEQLGPAQDLVQKRKYDLAHEFTLHFGMFPADPYYKGYTAGGGYTLHFSHAIAWELLQVNYAYHVPSHLSDEVRRHARNEGLDPPRFPKIQLFAASHLVFKPLYGKEALFNTKVVHIEAYAVVGPALAQLTGSDAPMAYGVDAGVGLRLWLSRAFSVRLDMGEFVYLSDGDIGLDMRLQLVLSANLRGDD